MRSVLIQMLSAKDRLPEAMRSMFDALFVRGEPDEQVAKDRGLSLSDFADEKATMMRTLMSSSLH